MKEGSNFETLRAEHYQGIVRLLRQHIGELPRLAPEEQTIARLAVEGQDVHDIAMRVRMSEQAVWRFLEDLASSIAGRRQGSGYETGGLGADTDPGVTGGYGDTAFGSLGNDPPLPATEEGDFLEQESLEEPEEQENLEERRDLPRRHE